jgi:hypothetical protein
MNKTQNKKNTLIMTKKCSSFFIKGSLILHDIRLF